MALHKKWSFPLRIISIWPNKATPIEIHIFQLELSLSRVLFFIFLEFTLSHFRLRDIESQLYVIYSKSEYISLNFLQL